MTLSRRTLLLVPLALAACGSPRPAPDAGPLQDAGLDAGPGSVGANGGTVDHLYFAVIGDTRPQDIDRVDEYPTAVIDKIFSDVAAMTPKPQFVITTGDYMYASTAGFTQEQQLMLYDGASAKAPGPIFATMGNHECTGFVADNCYQFQTTNMQSFIKHMVTPLGKTKPYYRVDINATDGSWTAKLLVLACNAWDDTNQGGWFRTQLQDATTYTFVIRHEPPGSGSPCEASVDATLAQSAYTMLVVGHSHTFAATPKQLLVGNGGVPTSNRTGYAIVEQQADGSLKATEYAFDTASPLQEYVYPK